jgi:hypothetical protein
LAPNLAWALLENRKPSRALGDNLETPAIEKPKVNVSV